MEAGHQVLLVQTLCRIRKFVSPSILQACCNNAIQIIWFIYDFSSYSFGIYSSSITSNLLGSDTALWKSFGWNTLINFFYMPGSISGAFVSDWIGPKKTLIYGVTAQAVVGFILAGCYGLLDRKENVGGFVVV